MRVEELILNRDPLYTGEFRAAMKRGGVEVVRVPPNSPNLNAYAERFVLSIRSECLDRIVPCPSASSSAPENAPLHPVTAHLVVGDWTWINERKETIEYPGNLWKLIARLPRYRGPLLARYLLRALTSNARRPAGRFSACCG